MADAEHSLDVDVEENPIYDEEGCARDDTHHRENHIVVFDKVKERVWNCICILYLLVKVDTKAGVALMHWQKLRDERKDVAYDC